MLESDPSWRLTILQLIKPLEEAHNSVLLEIIESVLLRDNVDEIEIYCLGGSSEGLENFLGSRLAIRGAEVSHDETEHTEASVRAICSKESI